MKAREETIPPHGPGKVEPQVSVMNSIKRRARLAGLFYLLLVVTNVSGLLCGPLVLGSAKALADTITASDFRFRVSIVSDLLSLVSGVFLILLLYELLKPVNNRLAVLMVVLFLMSAPVSLVLTLNDVAAQMLLSDATFLSEFTRPQLDALAMVFLRLHIQGVFAVEMFWGLWLFPFGILVFNSRFLPRVLGVFLIIAGVAYVAHCIVSLLLPDHQSVIYERATMVGRAGEVPIILWLLIKGANADDSLGEPDGA
jgi:hypothetical protein